jgi:hypothetical protein
MTSCVPEEATVTVRDDGCTVACPPERVVSQTTLWPASMR